MAWEQTLLGAISALTIVVIAGTALAMRDARAARLYRLQQEQKPIEVQIDEIGKNSEWMVREFRRVLQQYGASRSEEAKVLTAIMQLYERLEAFAKNADPPAAEIQELANEANEYIKQHRAKGFFVASDAERLAALVRKRNAA